MVVRYACGHEKHVFLMFDKYWRALSQNKLSSSCLFGFFISCIVQDVPLVAMYSLGTPHSSAVGVCLPLEYRSVALLDQGTLMDGKEQRESSPVSVGFY